jgi:hypothetical protein
MSDPFQGEPGRNPPRYVEQDSTYASFGWPLGILAAVFVLGVIFFSIATPESDQAANNRASPTTTGQSSREPARPLPANPGGTMPQPAPAQPQQ